MDHQHDKRGRESDTGKDVGEAFVAAFFLIVILGSTSKAAPSSPS